MASTPTESTDRRLILFIIPPGKAINGGILSIFSLCAESRALYDIHRARVALCTLPGTASYQWNDLFPNDEYVYAFDDLLESIKSLQYLQIHVPEICSMAFCDALDKYRFVFDNIEDLSVNILNQNIRLMPPPVEVARWFSLTSNVTQTTAHLRYTTQSLADAYFLQTHHLSVYIDPTQYVKTPYESKDDLIVLSPDLVAERDQIVSRIAASFPRYRFVTVEGMKYEDYKRLVSRAKFTITFGEGFDGYFIETFLSGGVAFAVYNDEFFPSREYSTYPNVYANYSDLLDHVTLDMHRFDNNAMYTSIVSKNSHFITQLYDHATYRRKLASFYQGDFAYVPQRGSGERLIGAIIADRDQREASLRHRSKTRAFIRLVPGAKTLHQAISRRASSRRQRASRPARSL
ncbi:MAG TPA: hypothetical protein VMD59_00860, partial [Acidimicrobiales bacterium]|nr:hypothetical protein [Acidimicrobiales bacterium]